MVYSGRGVETVLGSWIEIGGGLSCKDEVIGGHLDGVEDFGAVAVVGECGVDCDPNVDELRDL